MFEKFKLLGVEGFIEKFKKLSLVLVFFFSFLLSFYTNFLFVFLFFLIFSYLASASYHSKLLSLSLVIVLLMSVLYFLLCHPQNGSFGDNGMKKEENG
jgi:hypothetical protein